MVIEKLKLCIGKVVTELVPSPAVKTTEEITEDIANHVSKIKLNKMMEERNDFICFSYMLSVVWLS